jgi:hypothetical protein
VRLDKAWNWWGRTSQQQQLLLEGEGGDLELIVADT